jgi:hypothetical protein
MRRAALVVLVLLAGCVPAYAHHKPGHGPRPTTTTAAATTTTLPATTTTGAMPTTTVTMGNCNPGTPITITTGGTYTGCYRSTNPAVPAVTIETTQPVIFDHARVEHAGFGIYAYWDFQADLNIHDTTFQQLNPGTGHGSARAVYAYNALKLVFEYNLLLDGAGVRWAGPDIDATLGRVRYNKALNIGRFTPPEEGLVQFLQTTEIDFPNGLEVAWNHVQNTPGLTHVEDVMNFSITNGAVGNLVEVHHNLLDGSYRPPTTGPYQHTGSGLILGDQGGTYQRAHHNWFVATLNAGPSIPAGSNLEMDNNTVVVSGIVNGVDSGPDWGNGLTIWDNPSYSGVPSNNSVHDNTVGYMRLVSGSLERSDYWLPACGVDGNTCSNNTSMAGGAITTTDEQDARDAWEAARVAAGVTVGPR